MATIYEKLTAVCNAIRTKTGKSALLTLDQMASDLNAIPENDSSSLSVDGATVVVPAGNYKTDGTKSVATTTQATPSITVSSDGLITASATQTAGYVSAGTKSATQQLTVQDAQTIIPGTTNKTIDSGKYLVGIQTILGDSNLVAENIVFGKSIFGVDGSHECISNVLNFSVVGGTTQPDSPVENTIWINTSAEITSWTISPEEPASPSDGMVWIEMGDTEGVTIEALKTHSIVLRLKSVQQYIDGTWHTMSALIYVSDAWVQFSYAIFYIFNGSSSADYTGGWTGTGSAGSTLSVITGGSGPAWLSGKNLRTTNAIDLSNYSILHIVVGNYYYSGSAGIGTVNDSSTFDKSVSVSSAKEYTIDISGCEGNYYIKLLSSGKQNNSSSYASIGYSVSQIWLE